MDHTGRRRNKSIWDYKHDFTPQKKAEMNFSPQRKESHKN